MFPLFLDITYSLDAKEITPQPVHRAQLAFHCGPNTQRTGFPHTRFPRSASESHSVRGRRLLWLLAAAKNNDRILLPNPFIVHYLLKHNLHTYLVFFC
jgi:hypothetical protein